MITVLCALYGLSLALSISGAEICGSLLLIFGFIRCWKEGRTKFQDNPLAVPIIIYVGWSVLCTLLAGNVAWQKAFTKQSAVLIFFLVAYGLRWEELKKILVWYIVGSVVVGIWGVIQW